MRYEFRQNFNRLESGVSGKLLAFSPLMLVFSPLMLVFYDLRQIVIHSHCSYNSPLIFNRRYHG